jgi:hypothetical protein
MLVYYKAGIISRQSNGSHHANWREKGRMIRSKEKFKQAGRKNATG